LKRTEEAKIRHFFDGESKSYQEVLDGNPGVNYVNEVEKNIVSRLLEKCTGDSFLDIGMGTGRFTSLLRSRGYNVMGTDLSIEMLIAYQSPISLFNANAISLPIRDERFDQLICMRTLKYVTELESALHEFNRVLKPGGYAIVQFANKFSYQFFLKILPGVGNRIYNDILFLRSHRELQEMIKRAGFTIAVMKNNIRIPFFIYGRIKKYKSLKPFIYIERKLDKLLPQYLLARDFIFLLRKPLD